MLFHNKWNSSELSFGKNDNKKKILSFSLIIKKNLAKGNPPINSKLTIVI